MLNAEVIDIHFITPELFTLTVLPDGGVPDFLPGQYVAIGLPESADEHAKILKRAYSIGSSPLQKEGLELYIALVPGGALSTKLSQLTRGDRLFVSHKVTGHFTLSHVPPEKNVVFVATGTGLAPFMSMLRTPSTFTEGRTISVFHGVRFHKDLHYREELLALQEKNPKVKYFATASREHAGEYKGGLVTKGYVQELLKEGLVSLLPEQDHVLLCGNPSMIDDVERLLLKSGYSIYSKKNPGGSLHFEKYW